MPTTLAIADPTLQAPGAENATELAFYHDYVDHYRIAEHYFHGNLLPDERNDFQAHLTGCAECVDRVLLAELFDQESADAKPLRAAKVARPTSERTQVPSRSEADNSPGPQRITRLPSEARTPGVPPVPTPSDSAALQSLIASIAMPAGPSSRSTMSRRGLQRESRQSRTPSPPTDHPSPIRLVPREEFPASPSLSEPRQTAVNPPPVSLPVLKPTKLCSYLTEEPAPDGSPHMACNLPARARWVASFTPLELALIFGIAALLLLGMPSVIFLLSN